MNLKTSLAMAAAAALVAAPAFAQDAGAGVNPDGTTSAPIPYSQLAAADDAMGKVKMGGGHKAKAHKKMMMHHKAKAPAAAAAPAATPPAK